MSCACAGWVFKAWRTSATRGLRVEQLPEDAQRDKRLQPQVDFTEHWALSSWAREAVPRRGRTQLRRRVTPGQGLGEKHGSWPDLAFWPVTVQPVC